ncbi:hypothetical protein QE152_g33253 [Popillia japonica]|uniref:Uncharacterized protein n=1 Tax=Popillia japonica TaxID=7064 RepID=A0AAW1IXA1_POPJA
MTFSHPKSQDPEHEDLDEDEMAAIAFAEAPSDQPKPVERPHSEEHVENHDQSGSADLQATDVQREHRRELQANDQPEQANQPILATKSPNYRTS